MGVKTYIVRGNEHKETSTIRAHRSERNRNTQKHCYTCTRCTIALLHYLQHKQMSSPVGSAKIANHFVDLLERVGLLNLSEISKVVTSIIANNNCIVLIADLSVDGFVLIPRQDVGIVAVFILLARLDVLPDQAIPCKRLSDRHINLISIG